MKMRITESQRGGRMRSLKSLLLTREIIFNGKKTYVLVRLDRSKDSGNRDSEKEELCLIVSRE